MGKPPKTDPPAGRIGFDDRGNAVWEWRTDSGTFSCEIDTARVKALQEAADAELDPQAPPSGSDPYSTSETLGNPGPKPSASHGPRRTLDDMRKLSEEIKRNRVKKDPLT